jgi:hypothetical protein
MKSSSGSSWYLSCVGKEIIWAASLSMDYLAIYVYLATISKGLRKEFSN